MLLFSAGNIGNGLALLAIAKANAGSTLASKLVGYVAAPPVGDYNFRVFSNFDKVVAMLALREYDEATESTLPNISLNVDIGKKSLLNVSWYCPGSVLLEFQSLPAVPILILLIVVGERLVSAIWLLILMIKANINLGLYFFGP